jgi:hypothetical protein
VIAPRPGQLVISEFMPNAKLTDESVGEWFEAVRRRRPRRPQLPAVRRQHHQVRSPTRRAERRSTAPECQTVEAGHPAVRRAWRSGPRPTTSSTSRWSTARPTATRAPASTSPTTTQILDEIHYSKANDGAAWSLDPDFADPADNDDPPQLVPRRRPVRRGRARHPRRREPAVPRPVPRHGHLPRRRRLPRDRSTTPPPASCWSPRCSPTRCSPTPTANGSSSSSASRRRPQRPQLRQDPRGPPYRQRRQAPSACPVAAGDLVLVAKPPPTRHERRHHPRLGSTRSDPDQQRLEPRRRRRQAATAVPTQLDMVTWGTTQDGKAHQLTDRAGPRERPIDETSTTTSAPGATPTSRSASATSAPPTPPTPRASGPPPGDPMCTRRRHRCARSISRSPRRPPDHRDPPRPRRPARAEPGVRRAHRRVVRDLRRRRRRPQRPRARQPRRLKYSITVGETAPCVPVAKGTLAVLARRGEPHRPARSTRWTRSTTAASRTPNAEYDGLSLSATAAAPCTIGVGGLEIDSVTFPKPPIGKATQLGIAAGCRPPTPARPRLQRRLRR